MLLFIPCYYFRFVMFTEMPLSFVLSSLSDLKHIKAFKKLVWTCSSISVSPSYPPTPPLIWSWANRSNGYSNHSVCQWSIGKHGSLVVSTLAFSARGHGFDPRGRRGTISVSEHVSLMSFAGMTLNKCAVLRSGMLTWDPLCRDSHPLCRLKHPIVVCMITCKLPSCRTGVYNV